LLTPLVRSSPRRTEGERSERRERVVHRGPGYGDTSVHGAHTSEVSEGRGACPPEPLVCGVLGQGSDAEEIEKPDRRFHAPEHPRPSSWRWASPGSAARAPTASPFHTPLVGPKAGFDPGIIGGLRKCCGGKEM